MFRESGISKLIPSTSAFRAVHKQTAASRSTSPSIKLQHDEVGVVPIITPTKSVSILAHAPNFKISVEQSALTRAKKRRLSDKKRVIEA